MTDRQKTNQPADQPTHGPQITTLLRKRNIEYTIPAHTKLVSNVRFERNNGDYMVSTSYDGTAKVSIINNGGSIKVGISS